MTDESGDLRALAEAAQDSQWEQEWWQHHAADYWRSGMKGCPDLCDYLTAITPDVVLALLDRSERAEATVERVERYANRCAIMRTEPSTQGLCDALTPPERGI